MPVLVKHSSKCQDSPKPVLFLLSSLRLYDSIQLHTISSLAIFCSAGSLGEPPEGVRSSQSTAQDHLPEVHREKTPVASKQRYAIISSLCPAHSDPLILAPCLNLPALWR